MGNHFLAVFLVWTCLLLFLLRVLGQIYVALYQPVWLPEMKQWYSGLIPYFILLPIQVLILMWMAVIASDFTERSGFFWAQDPDLARKLVAFSQVYLGSMVLRYIVRMLRYSDQRWFGGTIPIFLHGVLAVFIYIVSSPPLVN